jgi:hypothetical protein
MSKLKHRNGRLFWHLGKDYVLAAGFDKETKIGWVHYSYSDLEHNDNIKAKEFAINGSLCYNKLMKKIFNDNLGDIKDE